MAASGATDSDVRSPASPETTGQIKHPDTPNSHTHDLASRETTGQTRHANTIDSDSHAPATPETTGRAESFDASDFAVHAADGNLAGRRGAGRHSRSARSPRWTPRLSAPAVPALLLVLVQISYPLTSGVARDRVTVVAVLLSVGTTLVHAGATRGLGYAFGFVAIVSGLGLLAEIVGTATGFPFGCYEYADGRLGTAVAGVPLAIALAWTGGLYPVWVVAELLTRRWAGRIVLTAVGAVGWDLFLDPQMVADRQWTWCAAGRGLPGLYEIPYTNYLGWFAVALAMAVLLTAVDRVVGSANAKTFAPVTAQPLSTAQTRAAPDAEGVGAPALELGTPDSTSAEHGSREPVPLISAAAVVPVAVLMWTWLGSTLAHAVFLDLPHSAWYGGVGLGVLGVPLLVRTVAARLR